MPFQTLAASTPATAAEVTSMLEVLGTVVSGVIKMVLDICDVVLSTPLLLIPFGIILLYNVIRIFKILF